MTDIEAIDILNRIKSDYDGPDSVESQTAVDIAIEALESKRHGTWNKNELGHFVCSNCNSGYSNQPTCMGHPLFVYCPICGADMRKST